MIKRRDIVKALLAAGFVSTGGTKHETFRHADGRVTRVGRHRSIPLPTARLIAKQAQIKLPI